MQMEYAVQFRSQYSVGTGVGGGAGRKRRVGSVAEGGLGAGD